MKLNSDPNIYIRANTNTFIDAFLQRPYINGVRCSAKTFNDIRDNDHGDKNPVWHIVNETAVAQFLEKQRKINKHQRQWHPITKKAKYENARKRAKLAPSTKDFFVDNKNTNNN